MKVKFTILGDPEGKGRPRFRRVGSYTQTYTPDKTVAYENLVKLEYRRQCRDFQFDETRQLDVRIIAYYSIPKSASKKKQQLMIAHQLRPMKKPDMDNVVKVILDSLNKVAYKDDVQVVDCQLRKFYSETPRVVVTIQDALPMTPERQKELDAISAEQERFMRESWGADYPGEEERSEPRT